MSKNLNLKIYGVTTVGPKGQIIIPKESRNDLNIKAGFSYMLFIISKKAFGLGAKDLSKGKKEMILNDMIKNFDSIDEIGEIKIGTKNQFVIPSIVRKELGIEIGDNLIAIGKSNEGIGFIKNDNINFLFEFIKNNM
ncbi:MAG: hypothetical protein PHN31_01245 [Candidatus Gracilibacteria bacterium]|nr:hypothetical protein [Candidatus Gracilibacteria bacterium]